MTIQPQYPVFLSLLLASASTVAAPADFSITDNAFHLGQTAQQSLLQTPEYSTFDKCGNSIEFVATATASEPQIKAKISAKGSFTATVTLRPADIVEFAPPDAKVIQRDLLLWCNGAIHTWVGKFSYGGYVFDSSESSPLQFQVTKSSGYLYVGGEGTVTGPGRKGKPGKPVNLPRSAKPKE